VIGRPRPRSFWDRIRRKKGIVNRLIHEAKGITITVLDTQEQELPQFQASLEEEETRAAIPPISEEASQLSLSRLISPERVVIWNEPAGKEEIIRRLVETVGQKDAVVGSERLLSAVLEREQQGSTFFNEGAAFPHARVEGLTSSMVSLGLTRQGVSDEPKEKPIELVFLIFSPAQKPDEQVKILALASRAAQNRYFRQSLLSCQTVQEIMTAIYNWELTERSKTL
jgi:mannitol/fructose-specific phosphotransferase system IIA component (Ntr-type)